MSKRYLKTAVIKELYAKSGNRCSFPGCDCELFVEGNNVSEICHIQGLEKGRARFNPKLSENVANSLDNLILLCAIHHKIIDQSPSKYTVEELKRMKKKHEKRIAKYNKPKKFYRKLRKIFLNREFDIILLGHDFSAIFPKQYFDAMEKGCCEIKKLIQKDCTLDVPDEEIEEVRCFAEDLEYFLDNVAIGYKLTNTGYVKPQYDEYAEAIHKNWEKICNAYNKCKSLGTKAI